MRRTDIAATGKQLVGDVGFQKRFAAWNALSELVLDIPILCLSARGNARGDAMSL
jgi:hypothetical protein